MKFFFLSFFTLLMGLSTKFEAMDQSASPIKVMSVNIRYKNENDGINVWKNRKDWLIDNIRFNDIDVFGAQEVEHSQLEDLLELLPEFESVGVGRDGGQEGEYSPLFYRQDRFELLDSETFWLSETPREIKSVGWDAAYPRIVTWAKLRRKTDGKTFYVFNTHFDHRGEKARLESAKLLVRKITEISGGHPAFVTGDFNFKPETPPYEVLTQGQESEILLKDSRFSADQSYGPDYTFNGFQLKPTDLQNRIDFIFTKGEIEVLKYRVEDGQRGEAFISDHFPVWIEARFSTK